MFGEVALGCLGNGVSVVHLLVEGMARNLAKLCASLPEVTMTVIRYVRTPFSLVHIVALADGLFQTGQTVLLDVARVNKHVLWYVTVRVLLAAAVQCQQIAVAAAISLVVVGQQLPGQVAIPPVVWVGKPGMFHAKSIAQVLAQASSEDAGKRHNVCG